MNRDEVFLHHILDEIQFLENQTRSLEFEDFLSDPVLQRAALRSLEIIGEASKNISIELKMPTLNLSGKRLQVYGISLFTTILVLNGI